MRRGSGRPPAAYGPPANPKKAVPHAVLAKRSAPEYSYARYPHIPDDYVVCLPRFFRVPFRPVRLFHNAGVHVATQFSRPRFAAQVHLELAFEVLSSRNSVSPRLSQFPGVPPLGVLLVGPRWLLF